MFGDDPFYHDLMRKYNLTVGTCFNDIVIERNDETGTKTQKLKVPLSFAGRDQMLARVMQDPNLDKKAAIQLPRMSFFMKTMSLDMKRQLNVLNQTVRIDNGKPNSMKVVYQPVAWNFNYELYIYSKFFEDGTKILEQILPYFKPEWDMTLNIIPELPLSVDVKLTVGEPTLEYPTDTKLTDDRPIVWTVPFTLGAYLYGPVKDKPVINFVQIESYIGEPTQTVDDAVGIVTVQPGLTSDGQPTSDANASKPRNEILVTDNFGYIVDWSGVAFSADDDNE